MEGNADINKWIVAVVKEINGVGMLRSMWGVGTKMGRADMRAYKKER